MRNLLNKFQSDILEMGEMYSYVQSQIIETTSNFDHIKFNLLKEDEDKPHMSIVVYSNVEGTVQFVVLNKESIVSKVESSISRNNSIQYDVCTTILKGLFELLEE